MTVAPLISLLAGLLSLTLTQQQGVLGQNGQLNIPHRAEMFPIPTFGPVGNFDSVESLHAGDINADSYNDVIYVHGNELEVQANHREMMGILSQARNTPWTVPATSVVPHRARGGFFEAIGIPAFSSPLMGGFDFDWIQGHATLAQPMARVGPEPVAMVAEDIDGDGWDEIGSVSIIRGVTTQDIARLYWNHNLKYGQFDTVSFDLAVNPRDVELFLMDADGDGRRDVFVRVDALTYLFLMSPGDRLRPTPLVRSLGNIPGQLKTVFPGRPAGIPKDQILAVHNVAPGFAELRMFDLVLGPPNGFVQIGQPYPLLFNVAAAESGRFVSALPARDILVFSHLEEAKLTLLAVTGSAPNFGISSMTEDYLFQPPPPGGNRGDIEIFDIDHDGDMDVFFGISEDNPDGPLLGLLRNDTVNNEPLITQALIEQDGTRGTYLFGLPGQQVQRNFYQARLEIQPRCWCADTLVTYTWIKTFSTHDPNLRELSDGGISTFFHPVEPIVKPIDPENPFAPIEVIIPLRMEIPNLWDVYIFSVQMVDSRTGKVRSPAAVLRLTYGTQNGLPSAFLHTDQIPVELPPHARRPANFVLTERPSILKSFNR